MIRTPRELVPAVPTTWNVAPRDRHQSDRDEEALIKARALSRSTEVSPQLPPLGEPSGVDHVMRIALPATVDV